MQDVSGKSENHAGRITVAIGLVKLWSTRYEIQKAFEAKVNLYKHISIRFHDK